MSELKKVKIVTLVLAVVLAVVIVAVIVMAVKWPEPISDAPAETEEIQKQTEKTDDVGATGDSAEPTEEMMGIPTPYSMLQYPQKWQDNLKYTEKEENGVYSQTYYCLLNGQEIEMFSIHFGSEEVDTLIGYVLKDGQTVPFGVSSVDVVETSHLTDGDKKILDSMCFAINDVIKSVETQENFIN